MSDEDPIAQLWAAVDSSGELWGAIDTLRADVDALSSSDDEVRAKVNELVAEGEEAFKALSALIAHVKLLTERVASLEEKR